MDEVDLNLAPECSMKKSFTLFVLLCSSALLSLDLNAQPSATKKALVKPDTFPVIKP